MAGEGNCRWPDVKSPIIDSYYAGIYSLMGQCKFVIGPLKNCAGKLTLGSHKAGVQKTSKPNAGKHHQANEKLTEKLHWANVFWLIIVYRDIIVKRQQNAKNYFPLF